MVLSRVISIDEAYEAVSWSTVFLLGSLIPLGQAVQNTGTADWIAGQVLHLLNGWPIWALQAGLAVLATMFTLVMSTTIASFDASRSSGLKLIEPRHRSKRPANSMPS